MTELTLQQIIAWSEDLEDTLLRIDSNKLTFPKRPVKPILQPNHTEEDVLKYAELLRVFNNSFEKFIKKLMNM